MTSFLSRLFQDEQGSMPVEWAFIATMLVLGAVTGAIVARLNEMP